MMYPLRAPAEVVASWLGPDNGAPVMTLPESPSTVTVNAETDSLAPKPVPVTFTAVPFGPEVGERLTVAAALAGSISKGIATDISRIIASTDALVALFVVLFNKLCIFIFLLFFIDAVETIVKLNI